MKWFVLLAVVAMGEALLHYVPWRLIMKGKREELPRVVAYVLGVLGMMVPFTVWLWDLGEVGEVVEIIHTLWSVIGMAGLTVMFLYWFDSFLDLSMKDKEHTEEKELHAKSKAGK